MHLNTFPNGLKKPLISVDCEVAMLKHLMNDTVEIKSVQNTNEYDLPVFNHIKTIKCKFEYALNSVENNTSAIKTKPARLFCYETNISIGDIVSYNSENYKVIQISKHNDLDGKNTLCEVFLS